MNQFSLRFKRVFAFILTLAIFLSGTNFGLATGAFAAQSRDTDIYTLIGEEYFPDDADAKGILSSGALKGNKAVNLRIPEAGDGLISLSEGTLTAQRFSSNYNGENWTPFLCYINGEFAGVVPGDRALDVPTEGMTHVELQYRLLLEGYDDAPEIPGLLTTRAVYQLAMLNKLSADTYMGYMAQMKKTTVAMLGAILDPNGSSFTLELDENDPQKDVALKTCFSEAIAAITANCFDDKTGLLKIYGLLNEYKTGGLAYYYRNYNAFDKEIDTLSTHLTNMLADDKDNNLTKEDKLAGLEALMKIADGMYSGVAAYADYLPRLEEIMASVNSSLTPPDEEYIDLSSPNLEKLTKILETCGEIEILSDAVSSTLTVTISVDLCNHIYDNAADKTCNICGASRGGSGGSSSGSGSGSSSGSGSAAGSVSTIGSFASRVSGASDGDVIRLAKSLTMTENVKVNSSITITNAAKLDHAGHTLVLNETDAAITADSPLNVVSGVDGYVPVKSSSGNTYTLAEVQHPKTGGKTAGSKTEKLNEARYLYLDLDPVNGMTLNALNASTSFGQLTGCTVKFSIEGNNGTGLVKTADRLVVEAFNSDGTRMAKITYVVIVVGDTNCNGKVNTSDAVVIKNIALGNEVSPEARMAADSNLDGTAAVPRISSSDVSASMAKWFAWDRNEYTSKLK